MRFPRDRHNRRFNSQSSDSLPDSRKQREVNTSRVRRRLDEHLHLLASSKLAQRKWRVARGDQRPISLRKLVQRAQQYRQCVCVYVCMQEVPYREPRIGDAPVFPFRRIFFTCATGLLFPRPGNYAEFSAALRSHSRRGHGVLFRRLRPEILPPRTSTGIQISPRSTGLFVRLAFQKKKNRQYTAALLETLFVQIFADACRYFSIQGENHPLGLKLKEILELNILGRLE